MKSLVLLLALSLSPAVSRADKGDLSAPAKTSAASSSKADSKPAPSTDKRTLPGLKK